jgi:iron(III) transport system substrate-binding protein
MAKPQFGTTATQAACLFDALGPDAAWQFYRGLKANDVQVVAGNKQAATEVSAGRAAVGLTDTDDALIEVNAGKPVAMVFPDAAGHPAHPRLGVLFIPNTLAVVRGGPNPAGAHRLIDFLLAAERTLAEGGGFQIPLNPGVRATLPAGLRTPAEVTPMTVDFERAADRWDEAQAFLRDEFAR